MLDRKDIDAVIVATGEFQRIRPCIHACQAGKDIYAEKPLTLYIHEGRVLVNAVRKHHRVFQVGSQQRSMAMNRIACELVRTGGLGKVLEVRAMNYPGPKESPVDLFPEEPVPAGLDWDMWLNQAAWRPFNEKWRQLDAVARLRRRRDDQLGRAWGGSDSMGARHGRHRPGGNVAADSGSRWAGRNALCQRRAGPLRPRKGPRPTGRRGFRLRKGKLEINRNKFTSNPKEIAVELLKKVDEAEEEKKWSDQTALWQARWHMQNWLDCIATRQQPVADVEIGHRSISVCHLANITRRLGRRLQWDPARELFVGDDEANCYVEQPRLLGLFARLGQRRRQYVPAFVGDEEGKRPVGARSPQGLRTARLGVGSR